MVKNLPHFFFCYCSTRLYSLEPSGHKISNQPLRQPNICLAKDHFPSVSQTDHASKVVAFELNNLHLELSSSMVLANLQSFSKQRITPLPNERDKKNPINVYSAVYNLCTRVHINCSRLTEQEGSVN